MALHHVTITCDQPDSEGNISPGVVATYMFDFPERLGPERVAELFERVYGSGYPNLQVKITREE